MATTLENFLSPLYIDIPKIQSLARSLSKTFTTLAAESSEQFLSTPISDSVLRPDGNEKGKYLAIDIGGTNLRVAFIELLGSATLTTDGTSAKPNGVKAATKDRSRVVRHLEKSWPIGDQLKHDRPDDLFAWLGECIAGVVRHGIQKWPGELGEEVALGVTFSFAMKQKTLSSATVTSMGKGFSLPPDLDLGKQLFESYEAARTPELPRVKITAIANDTVATLVDFAYQSGSLSHQKAAMGLIVGTGCNATIPLALSKLHPLKRPQQVKVLDGLELKKDMKIAVNTEWTIDGAAAPLRDLNILTAWDRKLDEGLGTKSFQPFEYCTSGAYLGELGRIIIVDFLTSLGIAESSLPSKLTIIRGLSTTFLGNLRPPTSNTQPSILSLLETELPSREEADAFHWTEETAEMAYNVAKAIQIRAAGMVAAAVIALLSCADEIHLSPPSASSPHNQNHLSNGNPKLDENITEFLVGYTGGCIVHFQSYLIDCQKFLDEAMAAEFGGNGTRVVLCPCHDGGIIGAGILAGTVQNIDS